LIIIIIIIIKKELITVTLHAVAGALYIAKKCLLMHFIQHASDLMLVAESAESRLEQKRLEFSMKA